MKLFMIALLVLAPVLSTAPAFGGTPWTFCVASGLGSKEIWITEVFAAPADRRRLEGQLTNFLLRKGVSPVNAQCPLPRDDKVALLNDRVVAEEFNQKFGSSLHAIGARDFP